MDQIDKLFSIIERQQTLIEKQFIELTGITNALGSIVAQLTAPVRQWKSNIDEEFALRHIEDGGEPS